MPVAGPVCRQMMAWWRMARQARAPARRRGPMRPFGYVVQTDAPAKKVGASAAQQEPEMGSGECPGAFPGAHSAAALAGFAAGPRTWTALHGSAWGCDEWPPQEPAHTHLMSKVPQVRGWLPEYRPAGARGRSPPKGYPGETIPDFASLSPHLSQAYNIWSEAFHCGSGAFRHDGFWRNPSAAGAL